MNHHSVESAHILSVAPVPVLDIFLIKTGIHAIQLPLDVNDDKNPSFLFVHFT
jgi:hypothetical protein